MKIYRAAHIDYIKDISIDSRKNATIKSSGSDLEEKFGRVSGHQDMHYFYEEICFIITGTGSGKNIFVRIFTEPTEKYPKAKGITGSTENLPSLFSVSILVNDGDKGLNDEIGFGNSTAGKNIEKKVLDFLKEEYNVEYY